MHIGHYISGIGHAVLVGWVLFGGAMRSDAPEVEVMPVAMVSEEEFAALSAPQTGPAPETEVAVPETPEAEEDAPAMQSVPDDPVEQSAPPESAEAPQADDTPDAPEAPPERAVPETEQNMPDMPEAPGEDDAARLLPAPQEAPSAPAPRVAPTTVAPPDPEARIDDEMREATKPAEEPAETQSEEQEATAPEAAADEIVTEPKREEAAPVAPSRSLRPKARPSRPTQTAESPETPAAPDSPPEPDREDAVNDALAEAMNEAGQDEAPARPAGPPLSRGERDALRVAVQDCWVVDVGSRAADVTVTVGLSLDREGRVQGDIRLISASGGGDDAARTAFQAARRAVLRCQKGGFDLPAEKYEQWRDIEMTFNPENMRRK
ncbi:hypothetical protein SAMN04490248_1085 [Salinihabitans flavidus]|uniref:Cell division and transport-associated protein TolA n=1 Tax=Salinihabitans flavidus TaxID=569882 RepID=A0A1H8R5H9_9RHOB|nr:hypothetical protein [Salinihabitans flavidus]SEO61652.1 hypothetical protein SAMN04490248_1085 [Salinihabitans flavidus]